MGLTELMSKFGIKQEIIELYSPVFKCGNVECNNHYALNYPDHEECYVPRDFFGKYQIPKKILVIGINPGKMLKSETREYKKIHAREGPITDLEAQLMVIKHLQLADEVFQKGMHIQENKLRLAFHKDFSEAISKILDVQKKEIFDYINYTTMVKCQTSRTLTKLKQSDKDYLINSCYHFHLKREIDFLKPELILTYGDIVYESLPWRDLIPIKVFNIPRIWAEASAQQRKEWRDSLDVMQNNIHPIISKIKQNSKQIHLPDQDSEENGEKISIGCS